MSQAEFAAGLLSPASPLPSTLKATKRRYDIYRNNVTHSLITALGDIFPVIKKLLGEECFNACARDFIRQHPPTSPLLFLYGKEFPDFLEDNAFEDLDYLPDIARVEVLVLESFHAADNPFLTLNDLSNISPDDLDRLALALHPAVRIVSSPYPIASFWLAHQSKDPQPPKLWQGETALITRPNMQVCIRAASKPAEMFLKAMDQGKTFYQAIDTAPDADLPTLLTEVFADGILTHKECTK